MSNVVIVMKLGIIQKVENTHRLQTKNTKSLKKTLKYIKSKVKKKNTMQTLFETTRPQF